MDYLKRELDIYKFIKYGVIYVNTKSKRIKRKVGKIIELQVDEFMPKS